MDFVLQVLSVSARNIASGVGPAVSAAQISIPSSLPSDRLAYQHTVLPAEAVLSSALSSVRSSGSSSKSVSHSAAIKSEKDQLAVDGQSTCSDVVGRPYSETIVSVSVCPDSLLPNTVSLPCKSDDVERLTETRVLESAATVTVTRATVFEVDAVLHRNVAEDSKSCDVNSRDVEQSRCTEVVCDVPENICSHVTEVPGYQPELPDSVVNDGNSRQSISATDDQDSIQTVGREDVVTETHLPLASEQSEQCNENTTLEELDVMERMVDVPDDGNDSDLIEVSVVSCIAEEPVLCAAAEPCVDDDKELMSCHTQLPEETLSSCLPSDVVGIEATSPGADTSQLVSDRSHQFEYTQSVVGGNFEVLDSSCSVVDVCSAESPTTLSYRNTQSHSASCDLPQAYATDTQQLPADMQIRILSTSEPNLKDKDATFIDQDTYVTPEDRREPVDFMVGESSITNSTFRRCSLDLSARGPGLSRIAEESAAGLAAVAGDMEHLVETHDQDMQQHVASGEYN